MRGDIIKLSEAEAVARAHIVEIYWYDNDTLVVILSNGQAEVKGDDARRVWETWTADRDTMADALDDYGRALKKIVELHEWAAAGGMLEKAILIAHEALGVEYHEGRVK